MWIVGHNILALHGYGSACENPLMKGSSTGWRKPEIVGGEKRTLLRTYLEVGNLETGGPYKVCKQEVKDGGRGGRGGRGSAVTSNLHAPQGCGTGEQYQHIRVCIY